ncbi:MAG: divalent-cation tolerance protein CutA [Planctomycetota bacterium]|nr:MAG: divalent-cation tolerance protein CutA [Planctomycetota bacterium]
MSAPAVVVVLVTAPDVDAGKRIAQALVEPGLAACVNVVPGLTSIYRWKRTVEEASEVLLLVKTTRERVDACRAALATVHPYEVPEFVVLDADQVAPAYAAWVADETRGPAQ